MTYACVGRSIVMTKNRRMTQLLSGLFLALLCGTLVIQSGSGDLLFSSGVTEEQQVSIYIVFNVNNNITIENKSIELFDLIQEAWENDSIRFTNAVEADLETILEGAGAELELFTMGLNESEKQVKLYYIVSGVIDNQDITIHNETRIFNPITFLVEVVSRNTTLTQDNTYECDMSWIRNGPQGGITYNLSQNNVEGEYAFEFNEIFDYSPLASITFNNWSQNGNLFYTSFNFTGGTEPQFLYASLTVFPEARSVYAIGDTVRYSLPEGITHPYFGIILVIGGTLIIIGIGLTFLFRPKTTAKQPIQKKWMTKRKRKR